MNNRTTYEQLIADKLQQLPIPDMADAIWARIEQQLNVEMPIDDQGPTNTPGSSSPGFRFPGNTMLYIFIAALATIYFLGKSFATKQNKAQTNTEILFDQTDNTTVDTKEKPTDTQTVKFRDDKGDIALPEMVNVSQQEPVQSETETATIETNRINPVTEKPAPQIQPQSLNPALSTNTDTVPPKKRRGVQGLNPNDYRIAPVKKDSLP